MNNYPTTNLEDIFLLDNISDEYRNKNFTTYKFNDNGKEIGVPRVSNILKECIFKEFLINWAAKIGTFQMKIEQNKATTIGTAVHEMIECYINNGDIIDLSYKLPPQYMEYINTAFNNFLCWENNLHNMGFNIDDVFGTEVEIVCPYYGGTIDCIMKINNAWYIIDFKTSKQISYEYIIQTCAYLWVVNNYYPKFPHINGIGIIRIDKEKSNKFNDLFLNEFDLYQNNLINEYIKGFGALLNSYYNNINMRNLFYKYKKEYNFESVLNNYIDSK